VSSSGEQPAGDAAPDGPSEQPSPGAAGYAQPGYGHPGYPGPGYGGYPGPGYGGYPGPGYGAPPDNYLVWAILSTILCCLPLGIVSIVYSAQVNDKWARGDAAGALESSRKAKQFAIWSAVASVVLTVVIVIAYAGFFAFLIGTSAVTSP
jgi:hypothetical protein